MSGSVAIEARDLTRVHGDVAAVDGVTFSVDAGTIFGYLGRNVVREVDDGAGPDHPARADASPSA